MTQRKWTTNDGWDVLTGWDRPLQHFFVNIDRVCRNCGGQGGFGDEPNDADQCPVCEGTGTEYLFNNLEDEEHTDPMGGMTIDQVRWVLDHKLTAYPEGLLAALVVDQVANMGNLIQDYEAYGEAKFEDD